MEYANNDTFKQLRTGWKERTLMNQTHYAREIIGIAERGLAQRLPVGQKVVVQNKVIKMEVTKQSN